MRFGDGKGWTLRDLEPKAVVRTLLLLAFAFVLLGLLWQAVPKISHLLAYPYPTDTLEGTLLHEARLIQSGEPLYQPLEAYRFISAPYPPVHAYLMALVDRYQGPHTFWSGRAISVAAVVGLALVLLFAVRQLTGSWLGGLFAAAVLLNAPPLIIWGTRIKPDLLGLLWVALGLLCGSWALVAREAGAQQRTERRALILALLCFGLAFFTKQTMVMGACAVGLALLIADLQDFAAGARTGYLWRLPLRSTTLLFGVGYLGLVLGVWAMLDLLFADQYTLHVWWNGERREWWNMYLVFKYIALLSPYWPLLPLALLTIAFATRVRRLLVPACYTLLAPITILGAMEISANYNHLLETLLGATLAAGVALGWATRVKGQRPALVLALAFALVQTFNSFQAQPYFERPLRPSDPPERFVHFIRNTEGEILSDDVGLLLLAGKPIRYDDSSTMGPTIISGLWDPSGLLDDIANRRFAAVLLPEDITEDPYDGIGRWPLVVRQALRTHYELKFHDRIRTYVPKQ